MKKRTFRRVTQTGAKLLLSILALLLVLTGCNVPTPPSEGSEEESSVVLPDEGNTTGEPQADTPAPLSMPIPTGGSLSAEQKENVRDLWYRTRGERLLIFGEEGYFAGARYYGQYGSCFIFFDPTMYFETATTIGGTSFSSAYSFELFAVTEDSICDLQTAFENSLVTAEQIERIADYHASFEAYCAACESVSRMPSPIGGAWSHAVAKNVEDAYRAKQEQAGASVDGTLSWFKESNFTGARYYGTIDDKVVLFEKDAYLSASEVKIESYVFTSNTYFTIWIYHNGSLLELKEAYDSALLSLQDVKAVFDYHNAFEQYYNQLGR